jgi:hypothetical protein
MTVVAAETDHVWMLQRLVRSKKLDSLFGHDRSVELALEVYAWHDL